jgi:hypothetical protein
MGAGKRNRRPGWAMSVAACAALIALNVLGSPSALAQGCAMCYQSAAASPAPGREALRHGILVLLVPAISLFVGIFAFIYCRRDLPR